MFSKLTTSLPKILMLLVLVVAAGCRGEQTATPGKTDTPGTATVTALPVATIVVPTPSPTPEPLAVRVNDEGISEAEYQAELRQLQEAQQALGKTASPEEQRQRVLDNLVDTLLLARAAYENGFQADDAAVQAEYDRLAGQLGSAQALQDWMAQRGYSETVFRAALKRQMAAAWQRDRIAESVPTEAEQVHARQILTLDEDIANRALEFVKIPGTNFAAYAYNYDPQAGGDLGWFPRGYLTQAAVEEAAFALQPGEISPVVKSDIGYHIVQVIAREPARSISPDARRVLQHQALQDWLKTRREGSKVEILLP